MGEQPAAGLGRTVDVRGATGVQIGDSPQMHLHLRSDRPPWWTRSGYIEQVRDIAPGGGLLGALKDRDQELAELAEFCSGDKNYLWWKAGPWAGKSALLSTFVLNPPPSVEVVSFFITARLAAQRDSTAFTDALIDQLSAIVGESVPGWLTPTARDAHRRALLREAINKVHGEGRRLVLVVDGLDEDRGGQPGSGLPSVASLLPKVCGEGLKVVVASRPNPRLPADVPDDHPLRQCRSRGLMVSRHARRIAELAGQELQELLFDGDQLHQDVLGLITACGGGLSLAELEELTGLPPYRLKGLLGGVFGRTVADRVDHAGTGLPRLYLFAHETLRETATKSLGKALGTYRVRLHTWAERYRSQGWPPNTPQYLLRGYPRMLADTHDLPRLLDLATDPDRHDRMLSLSGGDAAALAEITTCQDFVRAGPGPKLEAMLRLCIRRTDLADRNRSIPIDLPAVWAVLGQPARAESLARSITDPYCQALALAGVARASAAAGDLSRARQLVDQVATMARSITYPKLQAQMVIAIMSVIADMGASDHAVSMAHSITDPYQQARALSEVAKASAAAGDLGRAQELLDRAMTLAHSITKTRGQPQAWAAVAEALVAAGDPDRARRLVELATTVACSIQDPDEQAWALTGLARAIAVAGDRNGARQILDRAEALARSVTSTDGQAQALAAVAAALTDAGDLDRAESVAVSITDPYWQAWALVALARSADDGNWARELTDRAETVVGAITDTKRKVQALTEMAGAIAASDPDRARRFANQAETLARSVIDPNHQTWALITATEVIAVTRNLSQARQLTDHAEVLARSVTDIGEQARALIMLAAAIGAAGDHNRARQLAAQAKTLVPSITDPNQQAQRMTTAVEAAASAGDLNLAEALARSITTSRRQASELTVVAGAIAAAGDPDRAESLARSLTDPEMRARALAEVADAIATSAGDLDRAGLLLCEVLATAPWKNSLPVLTTHWPEVVLRCVDVVSGSERSRYTPEPVRPPI